MNDQTQRLRAAIAELERELAHLESSDPETRALLQTAAQDISAALSKPAPATPTTSMPAASPAVPSGQQEKVATSKSLLEEKVLEFEVSHPKISGAITRLIDALGQIGI